MPSPRAAVHVVHGMSEHGARYRRLAHALNAAGIVAWAHDHRGHGIHPEPGHRGHFADANGWRTLVDEAWAVSAEMRRQLAGVPLILFAHSMGSFVAQALMAEHGDAYRGVVLCGTGGPPTALEGLARAIARAQRLLLGPRSPGRWLHALVFGTYNRGFAPARTPMDWLSRDADEVDAYRNDARCGHPLSTQAWVDFLDGKRELGSDTHLQRIPKALPILAIAGTRDPVGEETRGVARLLARYAEAGLTDVSHRFYEDARHELINETNRDEVTRDLIAWIARVTTG